MGLFVTTTGINITIPELGITILDPTVDRELSSQFSYDELSFAANLTSYIQAGTLVWKKTSGGAVQPPSDYDPNYLEVDAENIGPGKKDDRSVTFKDLTKLRTGIAVPGVFTGSPRKATITIAAFPDTNYKVHVTSVVDGRFWTAQVINTTSFTIDSKADQALTGNVFWTAVWGGMYE